MNNGFKLIFMGTPEFAVPHLKALYDNGYPVSLVVTQPDRPQGRGRKLAAPPVKTLAAELGCDVLQPASIRNGALEALMRKTAPDMVIVVAYGRILPKSILAVPKVATINVHASLLPKYRGPAPIQWAVINGEKETGVTTMLMDEGMDTGDILLSAKIDILPEDTAGTLHDRLAILGADLLIQTLRSIERRGLTSTPQDHSRATAAPLLSKKDGHIDWTMPAEKLDAFIRGMTPWPGAFTFHDGNRLKIHKGRPVRKQTDALPGTVLPAFPDELYVATGQGILSIVEIQGASGRRMPIKDFLRGFTIHPGTVLN